MSVESPPAFLQGGTYGAEQTRRAFGSLLARGATAGSIVGGLVGETDCQLTPPGSGMTVNVAPGEIWVPGSTSSSQSGYYCRVSSTLSLSIAASDPTHPRIDTVVAQVQDAAYAGAANSFQVAVVTGTPTAGATLANLNGHGAVPASSLVIGYVLVPNAAVSIVGGDLAMAASPAVLGIRSPMYLTPVSTAVNVTAVAGQLVQATAGSITVTLPATPSAGDTVGVYVTAAVTGATPVTVSGGTHTITGDGFTATSFPLGTQFSHALLEWTGTAWRVIGGQQDTGWMALTPVSPVASGGGDDTIAAAMRLRGDTVQMRGQLATGPPARGQPGPRLLPTAVHSSPSAPA